MARIRSIKPEFWTSEQVADCSPTARLLFIGLWTFCDDQGVHPASSKRIKMEVFPADSFTIEQIDGFIDELLQAGLLTEFTVDNEDYYAVTGWKHQKIEKPTNKYPAPPSKAKIADQSATTRQPVANSLTPERRGEEKIGEEKKDNRAANASLKSDFENWYQDFPNHVGRAAAEKAFAKAIKKTDLATLLAGIETYKRIKPAYADWCAPATWLNQERWKDEGARPEVVSAKPSDPLAELKNLAWRVNMRMTNLAPVDSETIVKLIQMGLTDEKRARAYGWVPSTEFVAVASSNARVA